MSWKAWRKWAGVGGKRSHVPVQRKSKGWASLWLERLEDRLAPATFDFSSGTILRLSIQAAGATMDVYKPSPNQVQVVLGGGDVWQGTDNSSGGITGNGLATLTINTSLFTGGLELDSYDSPTPANLTFHGNGANGTYPTVNSTWETYGIGNVVVTDGTVAFGSGSSLDAAGGSMIVNSPITAIGNFNLGASNADLTVNAPITVSPDPAYFNTGVSSNGDLALSGQNVTINAAVQTAPITSAAALPSYYGDSVGAISILAYGTLSLNAPVSTGQVGSPTDPLGSSNAGINVLAITGVVGNAQGELSTGSTYGGGYITSGSISINTGGDITLPAPVAISTGDCYALDGVADAGGIALEASGNISADGASAPLNLNFGQAGTIDSTGQLDPTTPIDDNINDRYLSLGSSNYGTGTGNIYLASTGSLALDMESLSPQPDVQQTIDITTTGDFFTQQGCFGSPSQFAGDNISLASTGGTLFIDDLGYSPFLNIGAGNLTLTADEINFSSGGNGLNSDIPSPNAIAGTGTVVLQPATPGRNIAIGGDNTLANALNLSDNDLAVFASGFQSITIGRADDGTGIVDFLDNQAFGSPTTIYGGSFIGQGVPSLTVGRDQWASTVTGFSSQNSADTADQALGVPDSPYYGFGDPDGGYGNGRVWAPATEHGPPEYLELGYSQPVYATGVTVQEGDGAGFVYQVDLLDTNGNLHTVFSGTDPSQGSGLFGPTVAFNIPIPQTSYLVQGVKVYVNTNHDPNNWTEIDAVELQGVYPTDDLTLHAHTGSIGGAASTTDVYTNVFQTNPNPYGGGPATVELNDLGCSLPAGAHYSAQIECTVGAGDGPFTFTLLADGIPFESQQISWAPWTDQYTGDGTYDPATGIVTLDFEVDLPAASYAPLPALHELTVQAPFAYQYTIIQQTVTTTIPGGGANDPIDATAGATLNLITDAGNGAGNIYVLSNQALTFGQNVTTTTGAGRHLISLQTSTGDITVSNSYPSVLANDLYLNAAGSINLVAGLSLTAPVLSFIAADAINFDPTQIYTTTIGDLTLQCAVGSIGTVAAPLQVDVAGDLNLVCGANLFVTSAPSLTLGKLIATNADVATTDGALSLAGEGNVSGNAILDSATSFASVGSLAAGVVMVTATGSITGGGLYSSGNMNLESIGGTIGTSSTSPLSIHANGDLSATALGSIYIVSNNANLTVATLTSHPGQTVDITITAGGVLTTLFAAGILGDAVTLDGGTGGLIMQLPTASPLNVGSGAVTLIGDSMALNGPAGSLESTGPLLVQSQTNNQPITVGGSGGSGLDLTTSSINTLAPGFSGITIGGLAFANPVSIGGNVTFTSPTLIVGTSFADPAPAGTLGTGATLPLTLHALTGAIGSPTAPVLVNVGGNLSLIADAAAGLAGIYVTSAHALTLGQNAAITTGPGRDTVVLATSAGDITVPASFTDNDDLTLAPAGDLTIADGAIVTEASLDLTAGGAFNAGPTTLLVTTLGNLIAQAGTGSIGTTTAPLQVNVASQLKLTSNANAFVTSADPLTLGNSNVGQTLGVTTTAGGMAVAGTVSVGGAATLTSASSIAGNGSLVSIGNMTLDAINGGIGSANSFLNITVGGQLTATAADSIYILSPQNLTVLSLNSTPGQTVEVMTTGGSDLQTLFTTGLTDDTVTLDATTGELIMQLPSGAPLDFGSRAVTLIGDTMSLSGPANSLTSTGPLNIQTYSPSQPITVGGQGNQAGLDLTSSSINALAPGFSSITIGRADFTNPVSIGNDPQNQTVATFTSPTTIFGSNFADAVQKTIGTSAGSPLTLDTPAGSIGGALALLVNVGGVLDLIANALNGAATIFVSSAQALTLSGPNTNVVVTTAPGSHDTVSLATSAGDIDVNSTYTSSDYLTLQPAGNVVVANGVTLTAASLILNAGDALVTGPTTKLATTLGSMHLLTHGASIGTSSQPVNVTVNGGAFDVTTTSTVQADANVYISSPATLALGSLIAGAANSIVSIQTTAGSIYLGSSNTLNANLTLNSASAVYASCNGTFEATSMLIEAVGSIQSSRLATLATSNGDLTLDSGASIETIVQNASGTTIVPVSVSVPGAFLNLQSASNISITSAQSVTVGTLGTTSAGAFVQIAITGGGVLSTASGSGLSVAGDAVTLNGGTGEVALGVSGGLNIGNGSLTLKADAISLIGPAQSLTGAGGGTITLQPATRSLPITLGGSGPGLDLSETSLSAFGAGLSSISIGADGTNPVTTVSPLNIPCSFSIYGSSISDASGDNGSNVITTPASLGLEATSGNINANVNFIGTLHLSAEEGVGSINIRSLHALTLGNNTLISDEPGEQVSLATTGAASIYVQSGYNYAGEDDLTLNSSQNIQIDDGVSVAAASLNLDSSGALSTGANTLLTTTAGDLDLTCGSGGLGAPGASLHVAVAGTLNVTSTSTGPVQITSTAPLNLGNVQTADTGDIFFSSTGGLALKTGDSVPGRAVLEAPSSQIDVGDGQAFKAAAFILLAGDGITGTRPLQATAATDPVVGGPTVISIICESGDIGSAAMPLEVDSLAGGSAHITCTSGNVYVKTSGALPIAGVSAGGANGATLDGGSFVATNNAAVAGVVALEVGTTLDSASYNIDINQLTINQGTVISSGGGSITPAAGTIILGGNLSGATGLLDVEDIEHAAAEINGNNANLEVNVLAGQLAIEPGATVGNLTISPGAGIEASAPPTNSQPAQAGVVAISTSGDITVDPIILNTSNLALNAGSNLQLLNNSGTTPGNGYDQIVVSGPVSIAATANLEFTFASGYTPAAGTVFDIIQNNGGSPIGGTFAGLPEGGVFTTGGVSLQISYVGGVSGQDVTLTVLGGPPPTVTGTSPSLAGGTFAAGASSLQVTFSEPVVGADQTSNYQLQSAGADGILGTADDVTIPITSASFSGDTATLNFPPLAEGLYRLTVDGTITDPTGVGLDGTGAGTSGVNHVVDFVSTAATTDSFNSPNDTFNVLPSSFGAGELVGNSTAGYDAISHLQVGGVDYAPTGSPRFGGSSQDLITATQPMAGLNVSREITVPTSGSQDFARSLEILQNPTGGDITTSVTLISNLGTAASANVFATSSGGATPGPQDQWVGTQTPGGPAIIHYIHGLAGLTPNALSVVGDSLEWTYSVTVPAGQTVELGEFTILGSTQAGAIADANALVSSTGFGGHAGDYLGSSDLAALANFQFVAPPIANAGGPYTLKEGSSLSLDGSQSSDAAGYPLTYSWTINGVANAATGVQPTLTYAQLQALGINLGGTYNISLHVNDGQGGSDSSATSLSVVLGDPVSLAFQATSNNAIAGHTIPAFSVNVLDQLGTLVDTDTSTVTVAITTPSGATFSGGTLHVAASGGVATFGDLVIDQAGTYTLTASDGGLTPAASASFTVSADAAAKLAFEPTSNDSVAGQTLPTFQVEIEDQYGNLESSNTSTVNVAINSGPSGGSITAGTLSVAATGGAASFGDLVIQQAGAYTLVATDANLSHATSASFTISPAAAASLNFENTTNNAVSGQTLPAFKVDVLDPFGNLCTNATSSVTVALNSDPPGQDFTSGTLSESTAAGVATFSDLSIQGTGAYALSASDGSLTPAFSNEFLVVEPLQVTRNPAGQVVFVGQSAAFTEASANASDTVQWQVNKNDGNGFTNISGATATALTITNATSAQNGWQYRAVISNSLLTGSLASSPATLTVDFVTAEPVSTTVNAGQTASFSAASSNPGPDAVQWQVNQNDGNGFTNIAGANSATLTLTNVSSVQNSDSYRAVFTNSVGALTTAAATLTVDFVNITSNPAGQTVNVGQSATFTASASSHPADTVQWQVNENDGNGFTNINGATSTTFTLSGVTGAMNGFQYQAVFSTTGVNSTTIAEPTTPATLHVNRVNATINITPYSGTYDGNAHAITGTAFGVFGDNVSALLSLGAAETTAGHYVVNWSFAGNANYLPASGLSTIDIAKANSTVNWPNPANIAYGTALGSTQLDATANTPGTFTYTLADGTAPANGAILHAGAAQTLNVSFTPTDTADYNSATDSVVINVLKATPTITWSNPADITYGTALGSTQLDATANPQGSFTYTLADDTTAANGASLHAGLGQTLNVSFTPADATDYNSATASVVINVLKATPTITWSNPADITYGTPLGGLQLDATANVTGSFAYTLADGVTPASGAILHAGAGQTLNVSFTPTDPADYNGGTGSVVINVLKANPTITWSNPASITYGTALSGVQLDATANIAGTFTYTLANGSTPASGAVLNAGMSQTLHVSFTPTDAADYNADTASVVINVLKATPTISWSNPADITYGSALGNTQLDATANAQGTFTYTLADDTTAANGVILHAGAAQTLNVSFTPADTADYNSATGSVVINVLKATPTISWSNPANITYGSALGSSELDATANAQGTFTYTLADDTTPASGAILHAGVAQTLNVSFTPTDGADYNSTTDSVVINVRKATPVITWSNPADITYGTALGATQLDATANVAGTPSYTLANGTTAGGAVLNAGQGQTLNVTFSPTDGADYNSATDSAVINVNRASQDIVFNSSNSATYGSPVTLSPTSTSGLPVTLRVLSGPGVLLGDTLSFTALGNVVVEADQTGNGNYLPAASVQQTIAVTPTYSVSATQFENGTPIAESIMTLLNGHFSDVDGSATTKRGIAVIQTSGAGTWQYSANGTTWTAVGAVSPTQALLLAQADSVRFLPTTNASGQANLDFVAWDGSQGKAGATANTVPGGGTSPFSTNAGGLNVTITPIVAWVGASAGLTAITPGHYSTSNATSPAGNSIAAVFGSYFLDSNPNVNVAVAVSGLTGSGTWQYSTGIGATWHSFTPAPSMGIAYLLTQNDLIRFVPSNTTAQTATLAAYAWDGSGSQGATVNLTKTGVGAATGFSAAPLAASAPVNNAPKLGASSITGAIVPTNTVGPAFTVASLLTPSGYADPDGKTLPQGIAVTGTVSNAGSYQYMLAGGPWQPLPSLSPTAALLLPSTASLRVVTGTRTGTATLTFVAWDQTDGVAGQMFDVTTNGGATAFSTGSCTLSNAVQQAAPSWSAATGAALPVLAVNGSPSNSITVASVFSSFFQDTNPATTVGIAVAGATGNGAWSYSTDGSNWLPFTPAASKTNAYLLSGSDDIRFTPKSNTAGTATLTVYAWDGSVGSNGAKVNLMALGTGGVSAFSAAAMTAVSVVQTAPGLTNSSFALTADKENVASSGITGAALLKGAGYGDLDAATLPQGIAIIGDAGPGAWQWLKGTTWTALPSVSQQSAFLLPSTGQVRFLPANNLTSSTPPVSATLTYLGWDETAGIADSVYAVASQGGASPFSSTSATATMNVNFVKQAPAWITGASAAFTPTPGYPSANPNQDTVSSVFANAYLDAPNPSVGIAITAVNTMSAGVWQYYNATTAQWTAITNVSMTNALLLSATAKIRFVPNKSFSGTVTLTAYAWDGTGGGTNGGTVNLTKAGHGGTTPFSSATLVATCLVNSAPTLTP